MLSAIFFCCFLHPERISATSKRDHDQLTGPRIDSKAVSSLVKETTRERSVERIGIREGKRGKKDNICKKAAGNRPRVILWVSLEKRIVSVNGIATTLTDHRKRVKKKIRREMESNSLTSDSESQARVVSIGRNKETKRQDKREKNGKGVKF